MPVLQSRLLPFNEDFKTCVVEPDITLREVVNRAKPKNISGCNLILTVNNQQIREELWDTLRVTEGMIVGLNVVPTGGSGDGSKVLATVVQVLAVAAAIYTGGLASAAFAAGSYGAAAGWSLATVGLTMLGSILYNAIYVPPIQSNLNSSSVKESTTQFIEGASNAIDPFGIVPINLGTNRMFPKQAALPYTESSGKTNWSRQMFTWGYGEVELEEIKIGDTSLTSYDDYEIVHRLNGDLYQGTNLYSNDVNQENFSVLLKAEDGFTLRTTALKTNEAIIDFVFNRGLTEYNSNGDKVNRTVQVEIQYAPTGTENWSASEVRTAINATATAFTLTHRIVFDSIGQYDIRVKRITPDTESDRIIDDVYLSNIKSVTYTNPVKMRGISGTALRIKGTDQLNGSVDQLNAIVSTYVRGYDPDLNTWVARKKSSNPADLYRYVLQSEAFAKRLPDERINLEKLAEWWVYCNENNLTYNRIIDYDASIDEILSDICAAGVATPTKPNGIYSVIIDNERPVIKGLITPRNSWNYKGSLVYPDLPHALRIQFRNKNEGYLTDERIVYDEGYDEDTATLYERIEFLSCTDPDLAYWYGKRYFATAKLQPETHTFEMDFENLTFNRGDRIVLVNDVILVGVGQGRIKELIVDNVENPQTIEGFVIDDTVTIPNNNNFAVRIRHANGKGFSYYLLRSFVGSSNTFYFSTSVEYNENISVGSLVAFVEDGKELDLIVNEIKPSSDHSATITCLNYAPERFNPIGTIPPFESNVTIPVDLFAPLPPELNGSIQSDETVMVKNSDGSYISTMIIPLLNKNESSVIPVVQYRPVSATEWSLPNYLKRDPSQIVLTDLKDGFYYDFIIRYQRATGSQSLSEPLILNSVLFVGASGIPADVKGFKVTLNSATGLFEWTPNTEVDISHYVIRYTRGDEDEEITWEGSSVVADDIVGNRVSLPIRAGYFLIKAVDYGGRESENPAVIQSIDEGAFNNVVEDLTQQPEWAGVKENCFVINGVLTGTGSIGEKYYYFNPDTIDLGGVYDCVFASELVSALVMSNFVREWEDVRDIEDVRGKSPKIRPYNSIRSVKSIRGFSNVDWGVEIQSNLSLDGENWTGWQRLVASNQQFRYAKFRLYMYTMSEIATPAVKKAAVYIDLPDRRESQEDVLIDDPENGKTITYNGAFKNNPSVNITIQDGAVDDKLEYVKKDREGFTVRVFNATLNGYVSRTFDYLAAGYGREL